MIKAPSTRVAGVTIEAAVRARLPATGWVNPGICLSGLLRRTPRVGCTDKAIPLPVANSWANRIGMSQKIRRTNLSDNRSRPPASRA